jgi:hypothetical protein
MRVVAKYLCFIVAIMLLLLGGCKSKKFVFEQTEIQIPQSQLDSILENHNLDFEWYSIKSKIKYRSPDTQQKGTAYIRIKKDSVIWMVLKKFSVEGVRMQMTPDSITILDRLAKTAVTLDWFELSNHYNTQLTYERLQTLIVGNIYFDASWPKELKSDGLEYTISTQDDNNRYNYTVPFFEQRLSSFIIEDVFLRQLRVDYFNCDQNSDYCYARDYELELDQSEKIFLSLEFSNLELDVEKNIQFEVPPHYIWY